MQRVRLLHYLIMLSDPALEEALIEVPALCVLAGIKPISDRIHDESTILTLHHVLGKQELEEKIFQTFKEYLGVLILHCIIELFRSRSVAANGWSTEKRQPLRAQLMLASTA